MAYRQLSAAGACGWVGLLDQQLIAAFRSADAVESEWAQQLAQAVVLTASPKPGRSKRKKSTASAKPSRVTNATTIEPSCTLVVPVLMADGTVVGALGVAVARPRKWTVIHRARLRDLARCAAKLVEAKHSEQPEPMRRSA